YTIETTNKSSKGSSVTAQIFVIQDPLTKGTVVGNFTDTVTKKAPSINTVTVSVKLPTTDTVTKKAPSINTVTINPPAKGGGLMVTVLMDGAFLVTVSVVGNFTDTVTVLMDGAFLVTVSVKLPTTVPLVRGS